MESVCEGQLQSRAKHVQGVSANGLFQRASYLGVQMVGTIEDIIVWKNQVQIELINS